MRNSPQSGDVFVSDIDIWAAFDVGAVTIDSLGISADSDPQVMEDTLREMGFDNILIYPVMSTGAKNMSAMVHDMVENRQRFNPWVGVWPRDQANIMLAFQNAGEMLYVRLQVEESR
jgi:hypothetical protein